MATIRQAVRRLTSDGKSAIIVAAPKGEKSVEIAGGRTGTLAFLVSASSRYSPIDKNRLYKSERTTTVSAADLRDFAVVGNCKKCGSEIRMNPDLATAANGLDCHCPECGTPFTARSKMRLSASALRRINGPGSGKAAKFKATATDGFEDDETDPIMFEDLPDETEQMADGDFPLEDDDMGGLPPGDDFEDVDQGAPDTTLEEEAGDDILTDDDFDALEDANCGPDLGEDEDEFSQTAAAHPVNFYSYLGKPVKVGKGVLKKGTIFAMQRTSGGSAAMVAYSGITGKVKVSGKNLAEITKHAKQIAKQTISETTLRKLSALASEIPDPGLDDDDLEYDPAWEEPSMGPMQTHETDGLSDLEDDEYVTQGDLDDALMGEDEDLLEGDGSLDMFADPDEEPSDNDGLEYDMLEDAEQVIASGGDVALVPSGDDENPHHFIMVNRNPVATLEYSKASAGVQRIFESRSTLLDALRVACASGLGAEGRKEFGITPMTVRVPAKAAMTQRVNRIIASKTREHNKRVNNLSKSFRQCVATAMAGIQKGVFSDLGNPLRDSLYQRMIAAGVRNPNKLIDRAFSEAGDDYTKKVLEKALGLMEEDASARNATVRLVAQANYIPTTASAEEEDDDTGVYEAERMTERLVNNSAANLPSFQTTASSSSPTSDIGALLSLATRRH